MPIERSAGAIVVRKEGGVRHYLLIQYGKRRGGGFHWDFPKGHLEPGETTEEAIQREVTEETGLTDIEFVPGFRETIRLFFRNPDGKTVLKFVAFRVARTNTAEVRLSHEHIGWAWLPFREAVAQATYKSAKQLIEHVEAFLDKGVAVPAGTHIEPSAGKRRGSRRKRP